MPFLETSANNSNNIDELFLQLAKMLLESHIDKNPRSCEGGASSGSLVPVPCTASVQGCGSGGKPPLTLAVKTLSKQGSGDKEGIVLVSLIIDMTYSISVTYFLYCLGHAKFITFDSVNL